MFVLALIACSPVPGDWSTMFTPVEVDCAPSAEAAPGAEQVQVESDPAFEAMRQRQACTDDPFSVDCVGEDEEPVVEVVEAAPEVPPVAELAPVVQPAWGVRLLSTLPHAHPPRAALGLPDGSEVVVAPGSMLPEAGIIVVSVGNNNAQLARVTPEGDHAEIETVTLQAQYGLSDGG